LLYAIAKSASNMEKILWYMANGADINETDSEGKSALFYAIQANSKKLVKYLLECSNLKKELKTISGKSPIHYVVNPMEYGSYMNLEMLSMLAKEFSVNEKDSFGR